MTDKLLHAFRKPFDSLGLCSCYDVQNIIGGNLCGISLDGLRLFIRKSEFDQVGGEAFAKTIENCLQIAHQPLDFAPNQTGQILQAK